MKIAVLGTGSVGQTLARKLVALGHRVRMGSRATGGDAALAFVAESGDDASEGSFSDAAAFGEVIIVATRGEAVLSALELAGADNLDDKVLIDVSNPLDFSNGFPPVLIDGLNNVNSLGEAVQAAFPGARVVKTLNTVNAAIMVEPGRLSQPTAIFLSGNDPDAKATVRKLLESFGWEQIIDLGDISTARGPESYLMFWTRAMDAMGGADFNIRLVS